jgi:hypothetical protein
MQRELGWDKATLMGAFTLGLAVWGAPRTPPGPPSTAASGRA